MTAATALLEDQQSSGPGKPFPRTRVQHHVNQFVILVPSTFFFRLLLYSLVSRHEDMHACNHGSRAALTGTPTARLHSSPFMTEKRGSAHADVRSLVSKVQMRKLGLISWFFEETDPQSEAATSDRRQVVVVVPFCCIDTHTQDA